MTVDLDMRECSHGKNDTCFYCSDEKVIGEGAARNKKTPRRISLHGSPQPQNDVLDTIDDPVVAEIEREYPQLTEEFKRIQEQQYVTFCRKHHDYGLGNISMGEDVTTPEGQKIPLIGLVVRMRDKIERLKNLLIRRDTEPQNESVEDTFKDLSVYGIIAELIRRGKWIRG